jgi:hypothetical protein
LLRGISLEELAAAAIHIGPLFHSCGRDSSCLDSNGQVNIELLFAIFNRSSSGLGVPFNTITTGDLR